MHIPPMIRKSMSTRVPATHSQAMDQDQRLRWLRERDDVALEPLWAQADAVRRATVGDAVHLRGLIEVGNVCVRACTYCGISVHNHKVGRYRMTRDDIVDCARRAVTLGFGTAVLQGGEDPGLSRELISDCIRAIKAETPLAVTLSLGERARGDLEAWHAAGADRYLLRFETSNRELFARIHPPPPGRRAPVDRIQLLRDLAAMGYQAGSGVMVGIPGQTYTDLARDLEVFAELDLDMIGIGPWIPHPETPMVRDLAESAAPGEQARNDAMDTLKMVALARLAVPDANLPATTALATLDKDQGRELALTRGANVIMPNLTPPKYRALYELYPDKACVNETAEECDGCLRGRVARIGRVIGVGRGTARKNSRREVAGSRSSGVDCDDDANCDGCEPTEKSRRTMEQPWTAK